MNSDRAIVHFIWHNLDGELRHSVVYNDRGTGEDQILVSAVEHTNGVFDFVDQLFEESEGPIMSIFYEIDKGRASVVARK